MAYVIGTAPDKLLCLRYQRTRSANPFTRCFMNITKVEYNCSFHSATIFDSLQGAKNVLDEIAEREGEIAFCDVTMGGIAAWRKKLNLSMLKVYKLELVEVSV